MLKTVTSISNGNRVAKIFYSDLVDRDIAVIRLALDVFHNCDCEEIYKIRQTLISCKSPDQVLIGICRGSDQGKFLLNLLFV